MILFLFRVNIKLFWLFFKLLYLNKKKRNVSSYDTQYMIEK